MSRLEFMPYEVLKAAKLNLLNAEVPTFAHLAGHFPVPLIGQQVFIADIGCYVRWDGSKWVPFDGGLPDPVEKTGGASSVITSTTYAGLPSAPTAESINLPFDCWCDIRYGASAMAATANDLALGYVLSGATVRAIATPAANVKYTSNTAGSSGAGTDPQVKLLAGETTVTLQAKRTAATGTQTVYSPYLQIVPIRWA